MNTFEDAAQPFEYQVLAIVDSEREVLATMNGAYINLFTWTGGAWNNFDCLAVGGGGEGIAARTVEDCVVYLRERYEAWCADTEW